MIAILGLSEPVFRFGTFVVIFLVMTGLEAWWPRRERQHTRRQRWTTNLGILVSDYVAVAAVTFVVPITATLAAMWAGANGWGLFGALGLPLWAQWVIGLLALDFTIWLQHLLSHKIPWLWRVHRVHHSDKDFDATTAVRFHPIEIVYSIFIKAFVIVLLGPPVVLVVVFEAVVNGSALFNHANLRLPLKLDRVLRWLIVTPDMHRIHHSVVHKETDSNYGFALSIWDRMFKVYTDEPRDGHEGMRIGLAEWQDDAPTRPGWALALPFWQPPATPVNPRADLRADDLDLAKEGQPTSKGVTGARAQGTGPTQ